jgi:HK97 gp10 family phage protein
MNTREFDGVLAFAEHLLKIEVGLAVIEHRAIGTALTILERDMVEQIGEYQDSVGPYPAWATLADSTEDEKARLGYPLNAPLEREGDLKASFSHEQSGDEGVVGSTDPVMEYHEFGTSKMPPRPVVGPALERNRDRIEHMLGHALIEAVIGGRLSSAEDGPEG